MLRINAIPNTAAAKSYLKSSDYYLADKEHPAYWHGKGADMLGLSGRVEWDEFEKLAENRHPQAGKQLTAKHVHNRRVGYDFTWSVPKSVSVAYALGGDTQIPDAFRSAVADTMREIEAEMETRVRRGGANENRNTGNVIWADFLHHTTRPINGMPDPQLHIHAVVFNATYDHAEKQWKAGEFANIKTNAPYYQAVFRAHLANRMQELGYHITARKGDFEITGVPDRVIKEFSRRTDLIEKTAASLGVTRPETKAKLGATTREAKKDGMTWGELVARWKERITPKELAAIASSRGSEPVPVRDHAAPSIDFSLSHLLERKSAIPERQAVTVALQHGLGAVEPDNVWRAVWGRKDVIGAVLDGIRYISTREVLKEEQAIVDFAARGRGTMPRLGRLDAELPDFLSPSQRKAVSRTWDSHDRVMVIRGLAGVGKTTLAKTLLDGVRVPYAVLAPSAEASRGVLRRDGFAGADTLARFMQDKEFQETARHGLIVLDEASLAGSRDIAGLTKLADSLDARLLLMGDRRQHKSVARGDILRLLEDEAGLPVVEVADIRRQAGSYKKAVQAASRGDIGDAFQRLDDLGWIVDVGKEGVEIIGDSEGGKTQTKTASYHARIADDYLAGLKLSKSMLVVSPTHAEGEAVTAVIRAALRADKQLTGREHSFTRLVPLHLTEAERGQAGSYLPGDVVQFHRRSKQHMQGERKGWESAMDAKPSAFSAYRPAELSLAVGDAIRITNNGKDITGKHKLNNGTIYTVAGFDAKGNIRLNNGWTVGKDYGHFSHGYVVTSHASQGRTVDRVLIAQGSQSFPASGAEQFYVSISRGRQQATLYTNDREELLKAIKRDDRRILASDLLRKKRRLRAKKHVAQLQNMGRFASYVNTYGAANERQSAREAER